MHYITALRNSTIALWLIKYGFDADITIEILLDNTVSMTNVSKGLDQTSANWGEELLLWTYKWNTKDFF